MDPSKLDVRTVQRYLKKGQVDREAFDQHLQSLPDLAEDATFVDYESQFAEEQRADAEAQVEAPPAIAEAIPPPAPPPIHPAHGFPPATAAPLPASPLSATPPSVAHQGPIQPLDPLPGPDGDKGS